MARNRKEKTAAGTVPAAPDSNKVWRVALYIRLSRDDGSVESESVQNQKKILAEYLEQSFAGHYTVTGHYVDDGVSGTDDTRAEFMRMVCDIESGKVNCVVCKTLSRAFRNYSDQGYYLEYYFPHKNVRFISTGDPGIDTFTNPEAVTGLEVPITGLMNDRFAAKTSSDIRRTFNTKRRNGEFIGAFAPYGYRKHPDDKNLLVLDEDIVPIKRSMLKWLIADGMSLNGIARRLNELAVPNPTAYKRSLGLNYSNPNSGGNDGMWTAVSVKRILLDKVNLGHMVQGKQRVVSYKVHDRVTVPEAEWFVKENTHEPTFTQDEHDTVVRLLNRDTRTANGAKQVHLFSGFLRCAGCGKALQRKSSKTNVYYACRTYTEKSRTKCTKHSIRLDELEKAVLKAVQMQIALLTDIPEIIASINESPAADTKSKRIEKLIREKKRGLDRTKSLSDGLYEDWKAGDINREDYRRMKARFDVQIEQALTAIKNLEEEQRLAAGGGMPDSGVFAGLPNHRNIEKLDRGILTQLVDTVYVHENKEITIAFRFADELLRIMQTALAVPNPGFFALECG